MPLQNMKAIQTVTVGAGGASSISFTSIPQTYTDLCIAISVRMINTPGGTGGVWGNSSISFNGSTASQSARSLANADGAAASYNFPSGIFFWIPGANATASTYGNTQIYIPNYTSSNNKSISIDSVIENNGSQILNSMTAGLWSNSSAITSFSISPESGNYSQYSTATLYGVTNTIAGGAKAYGGTVTEDANYFYHTFLASGTFRPTQSLSVDCLVVAGGGSGGADSGGGGGAGGFRTSTAMSVTATDYTITVGGGGARPTASTGSGNSGSNSTFSTITSSGGGYGGSRNFNYPTGQAGANGGSGGGGGGGEAPGARVAGTGNSGSYSPSEGNNGGAGTGPAGNFAGGGGGGAGAVGTAATAGTTNGGNGGIGSFTAISGGAATNTGILSSGNYYFAGGGGGGGNASAGTGGTGGGGNGGIPNGAGGSNAVANTGGGGGGCSNESTTSTFAGAGGSGIVIIRYAK